MKDLDSLPEQAIPAHMSMVRFSAAACEPVDIRTSAETPVWRTGFGRAIPSDEIVARLDDFPCGALPVIASPNADRSSIVRARLTARRFGAKYLMGCLLGLAEALNGRTSETVLLEPNR